MKKVTKTLTGGLAAVMASGMVPMTAMAATNFDELHKAAYDAVKVAQETKTQADINAARKVVADYRTAIEAEGKDGLLVNINTFSELLDGVQQPILSDIVNKIVAMKEAGEATQAEINAVRELVDALPESLQNAVNTWSSEVDKFQNDIMEAAIDAVKTAEAEKTQEAVDAAKVLVEELATSVRPAIQKVAADLQARLDAVSTKTTTINVKDFYVTYDGVEVEFDMLDEAVTNATIEVVDNNGKTIEVQPVAKVAAGKTKYKFLFKSLYASSNSKVKGKWTVNGVTVDMTESKLVKAVVKNGFDGVTAKAALVQLQEAGYISRLQGGYQGSTGNNAGAFQFTPIKIDGYDKTTADVIYQAEVAEANGESPIKTANQLQEIIDAVNEKSGVTATEEERIAIIKEASKISAVQFVNALRAEGIERVNDNWASEAKYDGLKLEASYNVEINSVKTLEDVQELVDEVNRKNVLEIEGRLDEVKGTFEESSQGALNVDKVEAVLDLATEFINPEDKNATTEKTYLEEIKARVAERVALINVVTADNNVALNNALKKLSEVSEDFDYDKVVYEQHIGAYRTGEVNKETTGFGLEKKNTISVGAIVESIVEINKRRETEALNKLATLYTEEKLDLNEIKEAFKIVEAYTAKNTNTATTTYKFDSSIVVEANLEAYKGIDCSSVNALVKSIKAVNKSEDKGEIENALKNVRDAKTATSLFKALSNELLEIDGLVEANANDYFAELSVLITNAAQIYNNYELELENVIAQVNTKVELANATTAAEMEKAIKTLEELRCESLINTDRDIKDVAEELVNIKSEVYGDDVIFNLETIDEARGTISMANSIVNNNIEAINNSFVKDKYEVTVKDANGLDANNVTVTQTYTGTSDKTEELTVTSVDENGNSVLVWNGCTITVKNASKGDKITVSAKAKWSAVEDTFYIRFLVKKLNPSATNAQVIAMVKKLTDNTIENKTTYKNYTDIRNACK